MRLSPGPVPNREASNIGAVISTGLTRPGDVGQLT